ncbi:TPA: hypothetical protein NIK58_000536 [Vibrio cholerae]|uniref:hypothetical protein n=1 Tax=Vibrio cholerae TaxID=666 RepID=UPI00067BE40A|nr:hypothetical protein [Vibrio cholerae]EMC8696569.1 hypothetical protein [Vibrio cholerae]HCF7740797.1 hypothetical protein [Vibrio cholerae]HCF7750127.1 hypothetical protein [Vibrio cholerae]HCF7767750.1 hypothetical protein [Vibrio cholerae]HCF7781906.1 hypothetical protein [Vibrio cholerae]
MQLIELMLSRRKTWSHAELCKTLGIHVCDLVKMTEKAKSKGVSLRKLVGQGEKSRFWVEV